MIYADDSRIVKTVTRTNSRQAKSADDLVTSEYRFDPPEIGVEIPEGVFTLPYDIGEKP